MFAWPISTASRTGSQRLKLLAGLLLFYGLAASVAATPAARAATHEHVLRVLPNDRLTRDHLQRALAGSATARELVSRIERLQNVVLIVRAHPLLVRQDRLLGRGKFWVVRGRLFGLLEYQAEPIGSNRAVRILAHELAHALEVALAPRGFDTNSLRSIVLARESEERAGPVAGIETEFARAVGYRVQLELLNKLTGPSTLSAIAEEMHLALNAERDPALTR
jgi:hypothetical protein